MKYPYPLHLPVTLHRIRRLQLVLPYKAPCTGAHHGMVEVLRAFSYTHVLLYLPFYPSSTLNEGSYSWSSGCDWLWG